MGWPFEYWYIEIDMVFDEIAKVFISFKLIYEVHSVAGGFLTYKWESERQRKVEWGMVGYFTF